MPIYNCRCIGLQPVYVIPVLFVIKMAKSLQDSSAYFMFAVFLILVAMILQAIALATPNWLVLSFEGTVVTKIGLWQSCNVLFGFSQCEERSTYRGEGKYLNILIIVDLLAGRLITCRSAI